MFIFTFGFIYNCVQGQPTLTQDIQYSYTGKSLQRTTFIHIYIYNLSRSSYLQESGVHMKQK